MTRLSQLHSYNILTTTTTSSQQQQQCETYLTDSDKGELCFYFANLFLRSYFPKILNENEGLSGNNVLELTPFRNFHFNKSQNVKKYQSCW